MFQEEAIRLAEFIPRGLDSPPLPFQSIGDFAYFIGLLVIGGYITLWLAWKIILCIYYNWKERDD